MMNQELGRVMVLSKDEKAFFAPPTVSEHLGAFRVNLTAQGFSDELVERFVEAVFHAYLGSRLANAGLSLTDFR